MFAYFRDTGRRMVVARSIRSRIVVVTTALPVNPVLFVGRYTAADLEFREERAKQGMERL